MKLVVGLGNPGQKYRGTRHNIGFDVLASLAQRYDVGRPKSKFKAEVAETIVKNEKTVLLSPLTYMNLSGQSVQAAVDFYKLELTDLMVICDDLALDIGRLRIRPSGSAGGQKGLKDIINRLGTADFARLRVGIGKSPAGWETADYVLGQIPDDELPAMKTAVQRAVLAIEVWIGEGLPSAMNQFNPDPNQKPKVQKSNNQKTKRQKSASVDTADREIEIDPDNNNP